jgi:long-chain acyl-CoA synthetase
MSLAQRIRTVARIEPSTVAIEFGTDSIHWSAIEAVIEGLGQAFDRVGVASGQPVGLLLRNRPEMLAAILATIASGRCIVCVNPLQGDTKLLADLESINVPALVACEDDWESAVVLEGAAKAGSMAIALDLNRDDPVRLLSGREAPGPGPHRDPCPGVAVEMLTSGTTGPPKRIELRLDALEKSILGASHYESRDSEKPTLQTSFALITGPLVHIGGLFHTVKSAVDGRPVCLLERFSVDAWAAAVRRHRPKVTGLVPSAMKMVIDANVPKGDLASLRAVLSGTAPLIPELQTTFQDRYGIPVLVTYGATEFAGGVAGWTIHDHREYGVTKIGSVGRAHPGCELRVVDPESGAVLDIDSTGLLEVRSEQVSTREWVRTSDNARIDADGFLWIGGRADGAINRGGFKIDPAGVARVLEQHPSIREAAVVGLPDERLGEVPVAVLELCDGAEPPSDEELLEFSKQNLTRYHVPTQFKIVSEMPRTPALKPSLPGLRALFVGK